MVSKQLLQEALAELELLECSVDLQHDEPVYVIVQYQSGDYRKPRQVWAVVDAANYIRVSPEYAVHVYTSAHMKRLTLNERDRHGRDIRSLRCVIRDWMLLEKGGKPKVSVPLSRGAFLLMRHPDMTQTIADYRDNLL